MVKFQRKMWRPSGTKELRRKEKISTLRQKAGGGMAVFFLGKVAGERGIASKKKKRGGGDPGTNQNRSPFNPSSRSRRKRGGSWKDDQV